MNDWLKLYLYTVGACVALGLFELLIRLRKDKATFPEYRFTWGDLAALSALMFVPVLNILVAGYGMWNRFWNLMEKVWAKWDKPIITGERQK